MASSLHLFSLLLLLLFSWLSSFSDFGSFNFLWSKSRNTNKLLWVRVNSSQRSILNECSKNNSSNRSTNFEFFKYCSNCDSFSLFWNIPNDFVIASLIEEDCIIDFFFYFSLSPLLDTLLLLTSRLGDLILCLLLHYRE